MSAIDRRALLGRSFAVAAAGAGLYPARAASPSPLPLTAQTTEGPYYLPAMPLRSDITEALPGVPLEIRIDVRDQAGAPVSGCRVDVWHCDAQGLYSGFPGQGQDRRDTLMGRTFLRGGQLTDAKGISAFRSIYPGWYAGRTTHIHFKVIVETRAVLTSQFFLPDALSEFLYAQMSDYRRASLRDVLNRTDGIALLAGDTVAGDVREHGDRYIAKLTAVVDPLANPPVHRPGPGGGPPAGIVGRGGPPPGFGGTPALPVPQGDARVRALVPGSTLGG